VLPRMVMENLLGARRRACETVVVSGVTKNGLGLNTGRKKNVTPEFFGRQEKEKRGGRNQPSPCSSREPGPEARLPALTPVDHELLASALPPPRRAAASRSRHNRRTGRALRDSAVRGLLVRVERERTATGRLHRNLPMSSDIRYM
jgi:hypothetical protein